MPTEAPHPAQDRRWCDVDGAHVAIFSWVEQVAEDPEALFAGLHQRGEVVGRGPHMLYVRFQGKGQVIGVSPKLVRLLPEQPAG
ncbi:MAG: hypothetical protein ACRDRA_12805 [Pseudonocardiaceae bacterium]